MYSMFQNFTVSPSVITNASNMVYAKVEDALDPNSTPYTTTTILIFVIYAMYMILNNELAKQMELLTKVNKNTNDNFEILRDILQENNSDICAVREDVRSVRRSLNRLSKTKVENDVIDALVDMKTE